ncbi:uncharacterized protein LOC143894845 [Temnothorax americanus]|uniref:uncharacterized protein LOC143894845 n=1 Tax=Temnothorax americanus TaxID=1964332 RepID=UPI004068F186
MYEKERVDGRKKLKSSAVPTIFRELVIQQNKKNVAAFIPDTTSATEIVVASKLRAQGDEGYVPNIEAAAKTEFASETMAMHYRITQSRMKVPPVWFEVSFQTMNWIMDMCGYI